MYAAADKMVPQQLVEGLQDLATHEGQSEPKLIAAMEKINPERHDTESASIDDNHGLCAICLNKIALEETALIKGCEHAYCVTCILRWASCKKEVPTCPQCKNQFEFLYIHRALDGRVSDYMYEESVCLLLRAAWFKPLVDVVVDQEEVDEEVEDEYYDDEDIHEELYLGSSSALRIGNRRWGATGYVSAGRQEARRINRPHFQDSGAGPSQPRKDEADAKEPGLHAKKRALKREAADKAAAAKHQRHLMRLKQSMDSSYSKTPRFTYNPNANSGSGDDAFSGILQIHVHHARNIHNICIYEDQDVYAKFSLTYNPDETVSTRIINRGGKNPEFNEDLIVNINQAVAVLKCEIWMMSRAKNYMDDQLLGFALVPISSVFGKGKVTEEFNLSSTDLFHSPAGTIKLSLTFKAHSPLNPPDVSYAAETVANSSVFSELLLDKKIPEDYCRIEFPDMNVVNETELMVSEYFAKNGTLLKPWTEKPDGSFLHLGAAPDVPVEEDYDMAANSSDEYQADSLSLDGSIQNSGVFSSTMTSLSDDPINSADSTEKRTLMFTEFSTSADDGASIVAETAISKKKNEPQNENGLDSSGKEEESNKEVLNKHPVSLVRNTKLDPDESAMQQQIVDMYMRSMQQFTESLAKMKLPLDFDKPRADDDTNSHGDIIQNHDKNIETEKNKKKKDISRVFYGSRAFF